MNGYTNDVTHEGKRKESVNINYKCGKRMQTTECTADCVDLNNGCRYCKMCYPKSKEGGKKKGDVRACNWSRLGCAICQENICDDCWEIGYDNHA